MTIRFVQSRRRTWTQIWLCHLVTRRANYQITAHLSAPVLRCKTGMSCGGHMRMKSLFSILFVAINCPILLRDLRNNFSC